MRSRKAEGEGLREDGGEEDSRHDHVLCGQSVGPEGPFQTRKSKAPAQERGANVPMQPLPHWVP